MLEQRCTWGCKRSQEGGHFSWVFLQEMPGTKSWFRVCRGEERERVMKAAILHTSEEGHPHRGGERTRSAGTWQKEAHIASPGIRVGEVCCGQHIQSQESWSGWQDLGGKDQEIIIVGGNLVPFQRITTLCVGKSAPS